ncbi:methylated-DNA--[protein]-cysteine S-methyltransferase [Aliiroseovarius halocynthiae]|uniref:Methylated-DNA--protein-cysteine methyltransferase n=1 Tax=Aliiroseovarius halocynthiae TaxID=985055 RepID=A0A545SX31_9RHOB|nr:methylated-DNA--[protein]-cysteine S-methyltransferase [Aliiroseovarius halocynthiae]TQV69509.1 methylated-DNA--[protein]-cysteine S-methyltransferase [Aliiroseovarius halocynthiae]
MNIAVVDSSVGRLSVAEEGGKITRLLWDVDPVGEPTPVLVEAQAQLRAYFEGKLTKFDLPTMVGGSDFQRAVCDAMSDIPFGETLTYGEIAKLTGNSAQAVGNACGANPIPIIIPCHRVMGAGGKLVGFSGAGGVETKVQLLRLEGAAGLLI